MLNNFDFLKSCFGPDDEEDEKFEIKHKKDRQVSYRPVDPNRKTNKKKNKKSRKNFSAENKEKINHFNSDNSLIPVDRKVSIDMSKLTLEKKKFDIEYDNGNVEYKLKLCDVSVERIVELTTQMNFRLSEGSGECYYIIGVEDSGNPLGISKEELEISLSVINSIAIDLGCKAKISNIFKEKEDHLIAEMYIKKQEENTINKIEINIGVLGEEGAGKSTLIGVLINGLLDNGKGLSRTGVFRHKHEILCGKTSSFSHQILGFDEKGELANYGDLLRPSLIQIVSKSTKLVNFYDMAGSSKTFIRTTLSALSNEYLDYLLFVISAKEPITKKTEDFLRFIFSIDLPIITIITKIDLISKEELTKFINDYKETIIGLDLGKFAQIIENDKDIALFSPNMDEKDILLTFLVSNLTWEGGLTLFKNFLSVLPKNSNNTTDKDKLQKELDLEKMEFDIQETIYKETNAIVKGIVSSGKLRINSQYFLGPDSSGNFKIVEVTDIHCKKVSVNYTYKGQYCSACIKSIGTINTLTRDNVKKGMSLLDLKIAPIASRLFEIELWTIDNTTKSFKITYQPILNIKHIRQGVKIKNPDELFLFLTDNKNVNDLESLVSEKEVNLDNIQEKLQNLIGKKRKIKNNPNDSNKNINNINIINDDKKNRDIFFLNDEIKIGPNTKTRLVVEFLFNPEYISVGQKVVISDQSLFACGIITKIFK